MRRIRFVSICCVISLLFICAGRVSLAQAPSLPFPLGLMGPSVDNVPPSLGTLQEKLQDVAEGGFNMVFEFRSVQEIEDAQDYLNKAMLAKLLVIQNLPVCRAYRTGLPICEGYEPWGEAEWATFISTLAAHPNLVAWYLPDEIRDLEVAANLAQWVRQYDPQRRPVYAHPGTFDQATIDRFPAFTDFLWAVSYPELFGEPRALTTHMMKLDEHACRGTNTRWGAILQFFDSAQYPSHGRTGHPTPRQLRSDSYQAIIGGAKGLWYFNYEMGRGDALDDLWAEMIAIADEIIGSGNLAGVILSPDVPQGIRKRILSGPSSSPPTLGHVYESIQTLQKWQEGEGATYLFAANIATDTVTVSFSNLWASTDRVEVLFEGRSITITNGSFVDAFAADDVHIYRYAASRPAPPVTDIFMPLFSKSLGPDFWRGDLYGRRPSD